MSERYRPKQLLRERVKNGISLDGLRRLEIERLEEQNRRAQMRRLEGARVIVHCNHNVPWTTCTTCSVPRKRS